MCVGCSFVVRVNGEINNENEAEFFYGLSRHEYVPIFSHDCLFLKYTIPTVRTLEKSTIKVKAVDLYFQIISDYLLK